MHMAGNSRKEENTMPVEIAIKRELTHRRKVSATHLRQKTNSSKEILPLQVIKSTSQASKPMLLLPGPNSRPLSRCFSGTKRKEPTSYSHHHQPQKYHQPFHGNINHKPKAENIDCKICQVPCSSRFNLEQHLAGHKHREKLLELEFGENAGREGGSNQRQWCEICKVSCMNEELLKQHFQGKKHKAQLMKLEIKKQGGDEDPNKRKWCELCKLWCIDEFAFKQHLEGRKHIIQLHAMKKEKETAIEEKNTLTL